MLLFERKKNTRLIASTTLLLAFLTASAEASTTLKYSDHQPLDGMRTEFLNEVFFPAVERESKNRIKVDTHWNGEIAIAYKALSTLTQGDESDISTIVPEYTAAELPLHQIFKSFPTGPSGDKQIALFREAYQTIPDFTEELNKNNLVPIFLSTGYPAGFFSTHNLDHLRQIKAQKWRSASFWHLDFLRNIGANPVKMHWGPHIYTALDNGELDGLLVNIDSAYNLKLHKKANNVLVAKNLWLGHLYIVAMNKTKYDNLAEQDKQAIKRAALYAYQQLGKVMDERFDSMIKRLKSEGAKVRIMTKDEVTYWSEKTKYQEIQRQWSQTQSATQINKPQEVIQQVTNLINNKQ